MTMLDHGILRTAMTFSSTASCVAVAPRTRWMYWTSGETSGRWLRRAAAFRMLLSETVTLGARFIDYNSLATDARSIKTLDRGLTFCVTGELDECKTFRQPGDAIVHDL